MKKIIVLGSTGSIGVNTLEIIRERRDSFQVVGLSAHTDEKGIRQQVEEFSVNRWCLSGIAGDINPSPYPGREGLLRLIEETEADLVVNGIAGAQGLGPSVTALTAGKDLALANKETMVMAGPLVTALAAKTGNTILPVDSEHSAVFHLLKRRSDKGTGGEPSEVTEIILTASGGALRDLPLNELYKVTPEEALRHPNWNMGKKITIDSATMANKGLEVIEAKELFHVPLSTISVLLHPQSMVHSMIRTRDGSLYAQISKPDMRLPIQNALTFPELWTADFASLDLSGVSLEFHTPLKERYPLLQIALEAAQQGGEYQIAFNAANEVAVEAFLNGNLSFIDITSVVDRTLDRDWKNLLASFEQVYETDKKVREIVKKDVYYK